jgi:plasmid stabilization system protein ParE
MKRFRLSVQAARDIEQIWVYIAEDNFPGGPAQSLSILATWLRLCGERWASVKRTR